MKIKHRVAREGKVHVCAEMCSTCIFRPGNLMDLDPGRVAGMVREAKGNESTIVCHQTLDDPNDAAACRGFFDRYARDVISLRLAVALDLIKEVNPNDLRE